VDALAVKVLQYGVLGICALMLVATWRIIVNEQRRAGAPRKSILTLSGIFMLFCIMLAGINAYVQLVGNQRVQVAEQRLERIRAAATPLLRSRIPTINSLDDSPQKEQLLVFQEELLKALAEE
jgi:hypothetical protein